jgi:predicted nuclease of predicted toxin-antitoxin system
MTLLFDENISFRIVNKVVAIFPGSLHVTNLNPAVKKDIDIFNHAKARNLTIVTQDEDFYDLQLINGFPPKIIWMRMGNSSTLNVLQKLIDNKEAIISFEKNEEIGILEIY